MASCPISNERIDERVARTVGGFILFLGLGYLFVPSPLWLILLLGDFLARAFYRPASPLVRLARAVIAGRGSPRIVDAAPKIFAARIGLVMTLAAALCHGLGSLDTARAVIALMSLCAFFEGAFGYCVGCRLYTLWRHLF